MPFKLTNCLRQFTLISIICACLVFTCAGQLLSDSGIGACNATLRNNLLTLENNRIKRTYQWNKGNLISRSLSDKSSNYEWVFNAKTPDAIIPGSDSATDGRFEMAVIPANTVSGAYLQATCVTILGNLQLKRVFKIYPDCPAISCTFYLRGTGKGNWGGQATAISDIRNLEKLSDARKSYSNATIMEQLVLPGNAWKLKAVQFFDITDQNNNLVQEYDQLLYRNESRLKGNLIFASEQLSDHSFFVLKEAPCGDVQLNYPGYDFAVSASHFQTLGIGVGPDDISSDYWTRCYGFVTGVASGGEFERLMALRNYQEKIRTHQSDRDDMIMMNTWGDRSQDKKINEAFILGELPVAKKLGVTHYQVDDGWQRGRSSNSAYTGGSLNDIWNRPDYWLPDSIKFQHGLKSIVEKGKELGLKICIWFNPSKDSSYAHWKQDAETLISLYHQGIHVFKIDGVQVTDKKGEVNLRRMFDTVMLVTHNEAVFNLDVTAGRRYGYHYFNEYGNVFLENRYTDWVNYYPHWTLRNLWMLSRYVPPQNLQMEFLNIFRNGNKYPDNILAPSKMTFEYVFALTMMAQPLAWMEATGLPEKAFAAAPAIQHYAKLQATIHAGRILPIGDEPTGQSWTGFQSIQDKGGFLLLIREHHPGASAFVKTWFRAGTRVKLKAIVGIGKDLDVVVDEQGRLPVSLPDFNSYVLYRYSLE